MKVGYLGLGKMGKNMVLRLLEQGIDVVAWNRSPQPVEELKTQISKLKTSSQNLRIASNIEDLVNSLEKPKIVWLMLPAGEVTDEMLSKLIPLLDKDDLVIDGANSFYKDSLRRAKLLAEKGIHFMDIGVSGGPGGARNGACLMIGGNNQDYQKIQDLIKAIAAPNAYAHLGPIGAGHFAKMVHNGIEYGMMEALAEGTAILKSSPFNYDLAEVLRVYNNKSVIESRLTGWLQEALNEDPNLTDISSKIGATGEGEWTVKVAREQGVDARVIKDSYQVRVESEKVAESPANNFRSKAVSAMRGKFGGHQVKKT